jgi:predicted GIY-YIG superfamily endonuclease
MNMSDLTRQHRRTELYRHFDATGRLLYIGISMSTAKRLGEHKACSAWFDKVATITIERHPSRKAALKAERLAIQSEGPLYNVTGRKRGYRTGGSTDIPVEPWRTEVDEIVAKFRREHEAA